MIILKNIKFISFLLLFFISTVVRAQKDNKKKTLRIPAEISEKEKDSAPQKVKVAPKFTIESEKSSNKNTTDKNKKEKEK